MQHKHEHRKGKEMDTKMLKRAGGALLLAMTLLVSGCATPGAGGASSSIPTEVDSAAVKSGTVEIHGWVEDVVAYCKEHKNSNGTLVEVTGMISKGYTEETTTSMTLVDPRDYESEDGDDPMKELQIDTKKPFAEVTFAEPVETTKWRHLTGVKGMAFVDESEPNKIVIRSAIETKD